MVLPAPGGPTIRRLWLPAAATSSARLTMNWPLTSARSATSVMAIIGADVWRASMASLELAARWAHTCSSEVAG